MSRLLTCPQGHRWEPSAAEEVSSPDRRLLCPECGAAALELLAGEELTQHSAADFHPSSPILVFRDDGRAAAVNTGSGSAGSRPEPIESGTLAPLWQKPPPPLAP